MRIELGVVTAGWALADADTGELTTGELCEFESQARELRRLQRTRQPQRGELEVVPVIVTVRRA